MYGVTKSWIDKLLNNFFIFKTRILTAVKRITLVGRIITDYWERCDK
jgi:hypothetical protein